MTLIGSNVPRTDGVLKVTGAVEYGVDYRAPGMLVCRALRSHLPHAVVRRVDVSKLAEMPDVVVLTRDDLGGCNPYFGPVFRDQAIVAIDKVRYVGDVVAVVAAPDVETAEEAVSLIEVEYEPLPAVLDVNQALEPGAPVLHEGQGSGVAEDTIQPGVEEFAEFPKGNLCYTAHFEAGSVEEGFAAADQIFEDTYSCAPIQHAHLEPHTATAYWEGPQRLVVVSSTQDPWVVRSELAQIFNLPGSSVRVRATAVGGGYGGKLYPHLEPVVAALARKAQRPVQWTLTREEVFLTITRHGAVVNLRTGVARDGRLVARQVRVLYDAGSYAEISPRVVAQNAPVAAGPYRIPNVSVDCDAIYTSKPPAGAFRGFGLSQLAWAYESQMDRIAGALGMDPLALRLRNIYREGDSYLTGERLDGVGVEDCLTSVAAAIPPLEDRDAAAEVVRGRGLACCLKSTMTPSNSVASVRLDGDGSLQVLMSGVEIGQGVGTILTQIAAETLGVPMERVYVVPPDTAVTPFDHGTKSSRLTFTVGRAVSEATRSVRQQLLEIASRKLEVAPEDLVIDDGRIHVRGTEVGMTIGDVFKAQFGLGVGNLYGHSVVQTEGGLQPGVYQGKDSAFWMWAAAAVEVEVDRLTGKWRVVRLASAIDTGRPLNPLLCHMQNEGAAFMGLGSAQMEELLYEEGQPLNSSFVSYSVPSIEDVPHDFQSFLVESETPGGPYGAKGVGESSLPPIAPAVANALADALGGVRVHRIPIRPMDVLEAISEQTSSTEGR